MSLTLKYSLRVWLMTGGISFILSQIPLYYFYHDKFGLVGDSYLSLNLEIAAETLQSMAYLIIPWLFILVFVKRLYKPTWSVRQLKVVVFLVAEFLTIFFLLDGISIFNNHLLLPTTIMLAIFALSTGISIFITNIDAILADFFRQIQELE